MGIAQQNPARAHHIRCPEKIEDGDIEAAVEARKGNDEATWVFSRFDNEVRAVVRQSSNCKK